MAGVLTFFAGQDAGQRMALPAGERDVL